METIQLKDHIIIKQGSDLYLFQVNNKPRFQGIDLDNIIGLPYWSTFRKESTKSKSSIFVRCDPGELDNDLKVNPGQCGSDNRNIEDTNDSQSLTKVEILNMKDEGLSSQYIMKKLIENSTTFNHKTEFAQEKYLRKKAKKYTDYIQILKPNLRLLTEVLLKKGSSQLLGIRMDTLSQIITSLNIQADGTYLVYENNCQGLVLATILNALNDKGKLINIVTPKYPFDKLKALKVFQQSKSSSFINVKVESFLRYSNINECNSNNNCEPSVVDGTLKRSLHFEDQETKRTSNQERQDDEIRNLLLKKADGIVIVCKQMPNELVKELLQFIAPSRNFVVYCQYQEPLVKLYQELKSRVDVTYVRVLDNWLRAYQVLPNRTHPEITMSATGGYLLTGITVLQDDKLR